MKQETIEHLIKKFHLEYSISGILTIISIYFWVTSLNYDFLKIIGVAINIAGLIIWWSGRLTLAKNWDTGFGRPKIKQLVTHGIYSKIGHPIYWGINLTLIGLIMLYPEFWFALISLLIIAYFFYRMKEESRYLSEKLGEEYTNYERKTWI
jgi:protein-S-isoprenylcysteine O-methyltransferase Ste14